MKYRVLMTTTAVVLGAMLTACSDSDPVEPDNDPAAVFDSYLVAVHASNMEAVLALVSEDVERSDYPACTPDLTNKACLGLYIRQTVVDQHGEVKVTGLQVRDDTVYATLELRSDLTRKAEVERALGVDEVRVVDNQIVSFRFVPDFKDEQTARFFAGLGIQPPDQ